MGGSCSNQKQSDKLPNVTNPRRIVTPDSFDLDADYENPQQKIPRKRNNNRINREIHKGGYSNPQTPNRRRIRTPEAMTANSFNSQLSNENINDDDDDDVEASAVDKATNEDIQEDFDEDLDDLDDFDDIDNTDNRSGYTDLQGLSEDAYQDDLELEKLLKFKDCTIGKTLLILKHSMKYELVSPSGSINHFFFFDEGLNSKDQLLLELLQPRNLYGCPKIYKQGELEESDPGAGSKYYAVTEPLTISLRDLVLNHCDKKIVFTEDEILHLFTNLVTALISMYRLIDLHFITEHDIYLEKTCDRFVIAPFNINKRFHEITENFTYREILEGGTGLDPYTRALVEVLPPEVIEAWDDNVSLDEVSNREASLVYCLGLILFKLTTNKPKISQENIEDLHTYKMYMRPNNHHKVIPLLLKSTLAQNPRDRKPLRLLLEILKYHKFQISPHTTYKKKLIKLKGVPSCLKQTNYRSSGDSRIDGLMEDLCIGRAYISALGNIERGCVYYEMCFRKIASMPDTVDPAFQAQCLEILLHLCASLRGLEKYEEALKCAYKAWELCQKLYSLDDIMTARVLYEIGYSHYELDKQPEAVEFFSQALQIYAALGELGSQRAFEIIGFLAELRMALQDYDAAQQELARIISSGQLSERQTGELWYYAAKVLEAQGMFTEAFNAHEQALYCFEEAMATEDDLFETILEDLAKLGAALGREDVVEALKRDHGDRIANLEEINVEMARGWEEEANGHIAKEEYKQAIEVYQRVVELMLEAYGPKHRKYIVSSELLANLYEYDGNYEQAIMEYQEVLKWKEALYGDNNIRVVKTLLSMAECYKEVKKLRDTLELYIQAANIQARYLGKNHRMLLATVKKIQRVEQMIKEKEDNGEDVDGDEDGDGDDDDDLDKE